MNKIDSKKRKKLYELLLRLGKEIIVLKEELDQDHEKLKIATFLHLAGVESAPEVNLIDGTFHLYKFNLLTPSMDKGRIHLRKDNKIWQMLKESNTYESIFSIIRSVKIGTSFKKIIQEYVYDIVVNFAMRRSKLSASEITVGIERRAKKLIDDLESTQPSHGLVAPLYSIGLEHENIKVGDYAIIRQARYSESLDYSLGWTNRTGGHDFNHILELKSDALAKGPFNETIKPNLRLLASILLSLRLVCGGGVGTELSHYWIQIDMSKKPGSAHQIGESEIRPSRSLRPGPRRTKLSKSDMGKVVKLIDKIHPILLEESNNLTRAFARFGNSVETSDIVDRIIDATIGLECLFGGYSKKVIKMAALVLTKDKRQNKQVEDIVTNCYEARNKLVHGASLSRAEKAAGGNLEQKSMQLTDILRRCLIESLGYSDSDWRELKREATNCLKK